MADPNTPEEFREYLEKQAELLDKGVISQQEYNMAVKDAKAGMIGYAATLKASQDQLKKSFVELGTNILKGEEGASVYNNSINATTNTIKAFLSKIPYVGKLIGTLVDAAGKYATAVNEQADALFKNYKELSRNGLATGMKDTFENLQDMGYTASEIGNMGALVKENANTLANFGGTAAQGAKQFAKAAKDIQYSDLGNQFKLMGMTVDDINKGIAGYSKIQLASGTLQKQTSAQIAESAAAYMMKQDKLTKLTGLSADQQNSVIEAAMADQRYSATQSELRKNADAQSMAIAARNDELLSRFQSEAGPKTAKMFQDYASGMMNSEDAQKFRRTFGNAAQMIDSGVTDTDTIMKAARGDAQKIQRDFTTQAKAGLADDNIGNFSETVKIAGNALNKNMELADANADTEIKNAKAGADAGAKNMVDLTNSQRNIAMTADKLTNIGIIPVTKGMELLSEGLENATDIVGKLSGKKGRVGGGQTAVSAMTSAAGDQLKKIIGVESGGKNIANQSGAGGAPTSSAFGVAQMTKGTFEGLAAKAKEGSALYGKTFEDMKNDVSLQTTAAQQLLDENAQALTRAGITPTDGNVYLAHFLGASGAIKLLKASPDTKVGGVLSAQAIQANASVFAQNKTAGEMIAWADRKMAGQQVATTTETTAPKQSAAMGGILTGPKSGYEATLHGTEAVVPLPDGRTIPVQMKGNTNSYEQTKLLTMELDKLESLVYIMQRQNDISNQLLQRQS
jgi:hypothetical protein